MRSSRGWREGQKPPTISSSCFLMGAAGVGIEFRIEYERKYGCLLERTTLAPFLRQNLLNNSGSRCRSDPIRSDLEYIHTWGGAHLTARQPVVGQEQEVEGNRTGKRVCPAGAPPDKTRQDKTQRCANNTSNSPKSTAVVISWAQSTKHNIPPPPPPTRFCLAVFIAPLTTARRAPRKPMPSRRRRLRPPLPSPQPPAVGPKWQARARAGGRGGLP